MRKFLVVLGAMLISVNVFSDSIEKYPIFLIFLDSNKNPDVSMIEDGTGANIVVPIEIGTWEPDFIIQFTQFFPRSKFKVEQRMETSLVISKEGPHLDFTEWKHHYTEWKEMKHVGKNGWKSAQFDKPEREGFPSFSIDEIKEQVRQKLKQYPNQIDDWIKETESCKPPFDGACHIGLSRSQIRITSDKDGKPQEIKEINLEVAMGC